MKTNLILILFLSLVFADDDWCGTVHQYERDFDRIEYIYPQFIDSTHFRVHFTLEAADRINAL